MRYDSDDVPDLLADICIELDYVCREIRRAAILEAAVRLHLADPNRRSLTDAVTDAFGMAADIERRHQVTGEREGVHEWKK